jgi:hypothetical protein
MRQTCLIRNYEFVDAATRSRVHFDNTLYGVLCIDILL